MSHLEQKSVRFVLGNMPMPPSSNTQYWGHIMPGKSGKQVSRQIPSGELKSFEKEFTKWTKANQVALFKAKRAIREWLLRGHLIRVDTFACFHQTDIFTLNGNPKKMDGTNRLKALHDCLAEAIEIDDSWFWFSTVEKVESTRKDPWCFVIIYPWAPRSVSDVKLAEGI